MQLRLYHPKYFQEYEGKRVKEHDLKHRHIEGQEYAGEENDKQNRVVCRGKKPFCQKRKDG